MCTEDVGSFVLVRDFCFMFFAEGELKINNLTGQSLLYKGRITRIPHKVLHHRYTNALLGLCFLFGCPSIVASPTKEMSLTFTPDTLLCCSLSKDPQFLRSKNLIRDYRKLHWKSIRIQNLGDKLNIFLPTYWILSKFIENLN